VTIVVRDDSERLLVESKLGGGWVWTLVSPSLETWTPETAAVWIVTSPRESQTP